MGYLVQHPRKYDIWLKKIPPSEDDGMTVAEGRFELSTLRSRPYALAN